MVLISDTIYQVTRIKEFLVMLSVWLTWPRRVMKILVKIFAVRDVVEAVVEEVVEAVHVVREVSHSMNKYL
jgi:hypothetical protein